MHSATRRVAASGPVPGRLHRNGWRSWAAFVLVPAAAACATPVEIYQPTEPYYAERQLIFEDGRPQIEVGRPLFILDALNHYLLSLPTKAILADWEMLDHQMRSVKIRHNQWAPFGELRRLIQNSEVGVLYRATFGLTNWILYTFLPDRIFAGTPLGVGDHFNPYTNTIHVYSSNLAVLLHEAGHAKDYLQREAKGTQSLLRALPGIDLIEEGYASADALRFLQCISHPRSNPEGYRNTLYELQAYETLVPAYSTYISGYFSQELSLPIVLGGHILGRLRGRARLRALDNRARGLNTAGELSRELFQPAVCTPSWPTTRGSTTPARD
jgi:hypothetical protein